MEIEVGEYVRTNKGNFGKVILMCSEDYYAGEVIRATYKCDNGEKYDYKNINSEFYKGINQYLLKEEMILKHSKNIIDLIEVGDYVNGHKVNNINNFEYDIYDDNCEDFITKKGLHLECGDEEGRIIIENKDIKQILTHELYNQKCYRLEE